MSATAQVTEPGVYTLPADVYHADPALSSSGARRLLSPSCPALFKWERENGQGHKRVFDFGHAAHAQVLGTGPELVIIEAADYRTKAAQQARDETRAEGKVPLLPHEFATVEAMHAALLAHPSSKLISHLGRAEQSLFAKDEATGVMLRARIDWLPEVVDGRMTIVDYKTTASAEPGAFGRSAARYGYHLQAAWYLDMVRALGLADDIEFVFISQEKEPPYIVQPFRIGDYELAIGRRQNRKAIELFARCVENDDWPSYSADVETLLLPTWVDDEEIVI